MTDKILKILYWLGILGIVLLWLVGKILMIVRIGLNAMMDILYIIVWDISPLAIREQMSLSLKI